MLPTDSTHLSDTRELYLTQYAGMVESQFAKTSFMRQYVKVRPVIGTNTLRDNRVGRTTLNRVTPGVRPDATPTKFGTAEVTVDTVIYARDNVDLLDVAQQNFNSRAELGMDHGKELGKKFDQSMIIKCIHGSLATPADSLNGAFGAGKNTAVDLAGAADSKTAGNLLGDAIKEILVDMEEEDIEADEFVVLVRPAQYKLLTDSGLLDNDFSASGNGDFAQGIIKRINGAPIIKTARIPQAVITDNILGDSYNVTAEQAAVRAVIMHPKSILAGESIPMTSQSYFDQKELQHFVDTYMSYGANVYREDVCGAVYQS
jgi:hypothetical protein